MQHILFIKELKVVAVEKARMPGGKRFKLRAFKMNGKIGSK